MKILSFKPGHDGSISYIKDNQLIFSHEAEKCSGFRYCGITSECIIEALSTINDSPDIISLSGWSSGNSLHSSNIGAGYFGLELTKPTKINFLKYDALYFTSSHERSHLLCAYGMSPFHQGKPCYALLWEGRIGSFYYIDQYVKIKKLADIIPDIGIRYAFSYGIADKTFPFTQGQVRLGDAGKIMALAAYCNREKRTIQDDELISYLLSIPLCHERLCKTQFVKSHLYNIGVESDVFKQFAGHFSDAIFRKFYNKVKKLVNKKLPLLISGGCGLNCDWNRKWLNCGLFDDVFIPPCTNDSGSAIGTAIDAQLYFTGHAKIDWSVYCGQKFNDDIIDIVDLEYENLDYDNIAAALAEGNIIGWVGGNAEIGPRALGNRSILAAPFNKSTLARLNTIKNRESFRPIAPICIQSDAIDIFGIKKTSPHMLFFTYVLDKKLQAITHIDGSARPQTVNENQNNHIYQLLLSFKKLTGYGVLCNTSLNFNGKGFINKTSELAEYMQQRDLDGFVINNRFYTKKNSHEINKKYF
ncbi:putative transferase [Yersinia frederiksenii]|uniref:carbamoyltransferase C-terminal domain-containing protein n=1 Tax=Yersinia frederiksenii TaxID=29484 RepID=UPI0005E69863|nr:carbamoyltransferase C-terminal domain-containing protein [Yersinia frederiksenii]CNB81503.1 putative transferase [Yersinia frederiksenii]